MKTRKPVLSVLFADRQYVLYRTDLVRSHENLDDYIVHMRAWHRGIEIMRNIGAPASFVFWPQ